uniref:Uncharacterized protein n=1 Tax=Spongospora subterranea TaxID=70186 RepID=A0A0H5QYL4_9EUKA|eukprot:CRZ07027.1 hypothetical protein [Spongospora subterranea]
MLSIHVFDWTCAIGAHTKISPIELNNGKRCLQYTWEIHSVPPDSSKDEAIRSKKLCQICGSMSLHTKGHLLKKWSRLALSQCNSNDPPQHSLSPKVDSSCDMTFTGTKEFGQTKIRDLTIEVIINQYIT